MATDASCVAEGWTSEVVETPERHRAEARMFEFDEEVAGEKLWIGMEVRGAQRGIRGDARFSKSVREFGVLLVRAESR